MASNFSQARDVGNKEKIAEGNGTSVFSPKDEMRVSKRPHEDSGEDAEPEEKRPSFRLNPPTLIHGQAKSAPKDEDAQESTQKRNFLRPSILSAPATAALVVSTASSSVNGKSVPSISQAPVLGTGLLLPGQVPSNNPFLRTAVVPVQGDKQPDSKQGYLFQSTIEQSIKENGDAGSEETAQINGSKENAFLSMSNNSSSSKEDDNKKESGGFVFGSKMEERVMKNEADSTSGAGTSQSGDAPKINDGGEFLFGKNLSDRVKAAGPDSTNTNTNTTLATAPAESVIFHDVSAASDTVSSSTTSRNLEEDAAAMFAASNTKPVMPEVEVVTGEEDEKNVLRIQCKLFQYDNSSKNWLERGRGNLRLNDKRLSSVDHKFQSRLVMRCHGSLRLILNTKIWATMMVDRASPKSVRISAQMEKGDIGVYLIMANINDAEQIYRAVEYRVLDLKQLKEKEDSIKKSASEESVTSTEIDQIKAKEYEDTSKLPDETESSFCEETSQTVETTTIKSITSGEKDAESNVTSQSASGDNTSTDAPQLSSKEPTVEEECAKQTSESDSARTDTPEAKDDNAN